MALGANDCTNEYKVEWHEYGGLHIFQSRADQCVDWTRMYFSCTLVDDGGHEIAELMFAHLARVLVVAATESIFEHCAQEAAFSSSQRN